MSHQATDVRPANFSASARHLSATLLRLYQSRQPSVLPIAAGSLILWTRSDPFKSHRHYRGLPSSRCIWSARPRSRNRVPQCSGRSRYSPKTSRYQSSMSASAMVGSSTFFKFGDIRRLFSSQCLNWIDARCPPRRDQAGHHCDGHQHRRCARKRRRIERLGSIEH